MRARREREREGEREAVADLTVPLDLRSFAVACFRASVAVFGDSNREAMTFQKR
jgi:hypothetical protein